MLETRINDSNIVPRIGTAKPGSVITKYRIENLKNTFNTLVDFLNKNTD